MPEQWLDYRELAAHWQIGPDAARARVRRGNFTRRTNNFGEVEVLVDTDAPIQRPRKRGQDGQTGTATPSNTPNNETPPAATVAVLDALQAHVATLKDQLAKADAHAAELRQERDTLRKERDAERDRALDLTAQLMKRTDELLNARKAEERPRSLWRRLVG